MARVKLGDISGYVERLESLYDSTTEDLKHAVYVGAKVIADQVAKNIKELPIDTSYAAPGTKKKGITPAQKAGLKAGLGVARMRADGIRVNTKIGFDGYNQTKTQRWPKGVPNAVVARTVESGTSWMQKNAFVQRAVNKEKDTANRAMAKELDDRIGQHMKG